MAGKRAMTAKVRELSKTLTPEEMVQLALMLTEEADKPRLDKKQHAKLKRAVGSAYERLLLAEEALTTLLVEAGQANDEINAEIADVRREAERRVMPQPPVRKGKARAKKAPVQLDLA